MKGKASRERVHLSWALTRSGIWIYWDGEGKFGIQGEEKPKFEHTWKKTEA